MLLKDFYEVLESQKNGEHYQTEIKINKKHPIYDGHFPNRPVTPGVILMQLFKEEAERQTGFNLQLSKAANVKFMAVVNPNDCENYTLLLDSEITKNGELINLRGIAKHKDCISLKINSVYKIIST